jgi:hypothetical protein
MIKLNPPFNKEITLSQIQYDKLLSSWEQVQKQKNSCKKYHKTELGKAALKRAQILYRKKKKKSIS